MPPYILKNIKFEDIDYLMIWLDQSNIIDSGKLFASAPEFKRKGFVLIDHLLISGESACRFLKFPFCSGVIDFSSSVLINPPSEIKLIAFSVIKNYPNAFKFRFYLGRNLLNQLKNGALSYI